MKIQTFGLFFLAVLGVAGAYACGDSVDSKGSPVNADTCPADHVLQGGTCVLSCGANRHEENGRCADDAANPLECGANRHEENGRCVDDAANLLECGANRHEENGRCVDDAPDPDGDVPADPCKNVSCARGTCQQGVCVTDEMKALKNDDPCDIESFVEFCDGDTTFYCDQGFVQTGVCEAGCVVYEETFFGRKKMQSGCIEGGSCTQIDELRRTCEIVGKQTPVVWATACQRTTSGELRYVSVDGYYCMGSCDAKGEKCQLVDGECDPYDKSNYACDGTRLAQCYLSNELVGIKREVTCEDSCVAVGGIAMCGKPCETEGERSRLCVFAESTTFTDAGDMICTHGDDGKLYSVWTRNYEYCDDGCDSRTGECK